MPGSFRIWCRRNKGDDIDTETKNIVEDIKEEVDITLQMTLKPKDNLTYKQRQALKKLIIDDTIIINKVDKGSTFVIQDRDT